MFSSLRSRLWLSYAIITGVALTVVACVLLIYLFNNPVIYRATALKLINVQKSLLDEQGKWSTLPSENLGEFFSLNSEKSNVRIIIYDPLRRVVTDTGPSESVIKMPRLPRLRSFSILRDNQGNHWLYALKRLENRDWLLVASPRPNVNMFAIFSDDLFIPILGSAMVALFLSLVLAFLISRWVADPLQNMVVASRDFPGKGQGGLPVEGPEEVREVIAAFNEMSVRVNHSQEAQRAFVANVSHELKTPLTSIRGFAQAILDGTAGTEMDRLNAAQIIYDETGRMHRMVLALLDLARLDAGNFVLKVDQVEPVLLLGTVAEKLAIQARDAGVKVEVSAAKDLPLITGDGDRLAQVFTNLVENAIRYSPGNGTVRITLALTGNFLNVDIADEGPGIPEQDIPYIFDRFYQVDVSRQHGSGHGAGLGLAIAKEIVIAHRGTITAQSAPGNGSVFSVRLPVESPAPIKPGQSKNRRSIAQ